MPTITIQKLLVHRGDECVVLGSDSKRRLLLGVSQGQSDEDDFVFVRISARMLFKLEHSAVDLSAAIGKLRAAGSIDSTP